MLIVQTPAGHAIRALPALSGLGVLVWLFVRLLPRDASTPVGWELLGKLAVAVAIAFAVAGLVRSAIGSMSRRDDAGSARAHDSGLRDRIAPVVLGVGSAAIVALSLGLIIAFTRLASDSNSDVAKKIDSLLMGVFTAVLPVFATWVGTVIAFYFTNESYRAAAENAREAALGAQPAARVSDRMIPYEKIAKIEIERAEVRTIPMDRVVSMFNDNTTRVIVFDKSRQPVFVLRRRSPPMPKDWLNEDGTFNTETLKGKTINDYLQFAGNADDAARYGFVAETDTLERARSEMLAARSVDLFVTKSRQKTEAVLGWLPDDKLKQDGGSR